MKACDLIIIGAGPGGYETAVKAAQEGLKTVIIEMDKVGGTCLNVGCIPTKCFCKNAEIVESLKDADAYGIENLSYSFNFSKVVERKNQVIANLGTGIETLLKHPQITKVQGKAHFIDAHTIEVQNIDTSSTEENIENLYTAPNIIIATGSVTKYLPIEGAHLSKVYTSTEMLDITKIPKSICVIGGGVIGLEFASIFNAFGSKVTVIEFCKEVLPNFDNDIAKRLKLSLKGKGITFITQAAVTKIQESDDELTVSYETKGKVLETQAEIVLMAVGRVANTESLNLADVGITFNRQGIETDENLETNVNGIYAIGDINGKCQLAHAATFQGIHALNHIMGKKDNIRMDVIPAAVFTYPEAAMVGMTEEQCKASGMVFNIHKSFFRSNGKALSMNESDGMVKLVTDENDKIIGCHLFGPHAADLIQEVSSLICRDVTRKDLGDMIHAHPTLGEVILNAAHT